MISSTILKRFLVAAFYAVGSLGVAHAGPWNGTDIGSPSITGTDSYNSSTGVYSLAGSGADINGIADAGHFVYQTLTADGELEARVASIQNTNASARAGVMIRQSTTAGSIHAFIAVTPASGINFEQRTTLNGSTTLAQTSSSGTAPYWLKIIKDGTLISVYQSPDGASWTYEGAVRLTLTSPVEVGFAVTSHNNAALCTATFDNIGFTPQTSFAPVFPWSEVEIGTPTQLGQVHLEEYLWSIYGGGTGIGGSSDSFHFAYQPMSGNGMVIAQVSAVSAATGSTGVMIRQDLSAGSAEADTMFSATGGISFGTRSSAGASLATVAGANVAAPYWIKLVRVGNIFYGYQSVDGTTWALVGSQTVSMTGTVYAGVSSSCGNNGALSLGILDRVWVLPAGDYLSIGAISSGASHNLYLQPGGNVWAWGLNASGQLGDGTTTTRLSPVQVTGLSSISAVSAGTAHSVALGSDGTVWVWGGNVSGQLGDGTTTQELAPEHLSTLSGVVAISAGAAHTLALANDGSVWAWGDNSSGELGDGTTTQHPAPEHLTTPTGIVAISAGSNFSLALKADGTLFAWGKNASGQLGDGTITQKLAPEQITSIANIAFISAGTSHSLVVGDDGSVWAWGDNSSGELGNGTTTGTSTPIQVASLGGITAVKASNLFSIGLKNDGTVWTWGNNASGQLGNDTTTEQNNPVQAFNITGALAISAGNSFGSALTSNAIWTWGDNTYGQLGDGTTLASLVPYAINPDVPVITSPATASGITGAAFSYTIAASNLPSSYAATGLPAGLSLNKSTGVISGTLPAVGTYTISISATNLTGTGSQMLTLSVLTGVPVITSATSATGTTGTAFSYNLTASNGPTSFSAAGLAPGLSINTATGAISGTPTVAGTYTVSLAAANVSGKGTATLTLTINAPTPVITSATAATGVTGVAFSYQVTANNSPVNFSATGLPTGLSINTSTGAITGTPGSSGIASVTLGATNGSGTGSATLTLTINAPAPVITSGTTATGTLGVAFSGYTIAATNSPASYSASGLPPGLIVNASTGPITGTPTNAGTFSVTVAATNATGTGTATVTCTINAPNPVITSATTATATKGVAFSGYTITANNSPISFSATGLPGGLTVNTATGAISGTPTTTGTSTVTIKATNPSGTGSASLAFTVNSPTPVISSATTATGTNGTAFSYSIVASNTPTSYEATGLPSGLAVNTSTGAITGTPTQVGTFTVTLGATNASGTGKATLTLTLNAAKPVITSAPSAIGTTSAAFSYSITANNSPTSYNATNLPAGLTVNTSTGAITGTPTATGTATVALSAINVTGTGTANLSLTINAPKPVISSASTATGTVGTAFSGYTIAASNTPTSFGATGLPPGLTVSASTGAITGTPTTPGTYTVTMGASNVTGTGTATLTFTIISPLPVINSLLTAQGTTGAAFSYSITATNNPTSYSATGLPAGLSISTTTGKISGTPTITGTSTVTIGATNASGPATASLSLTINPPQPVISSAATASGTIGTAFAGYTIVASNTPTSYTASGLPAGLSINAATGVISGTATAEGIFSVSLGATNAGGTGTKTLTLTILPLAPVISSATTATGTLGGAFSSYTVVASNTPTSFSATSLPAGLAINTATGAITGTPTTAGTSSVTLGATNTGGTGHATLTFTVNPAIPVIYSATAASGATGVAFNSYKILASNSPASYNATGLPAGLSVNTTTGAISGTPTAAGSSTVALSATNASGTGTGTLTLTIASLPTPVISSATTVTGTLGVAFSGYTIAASNSPTSYNASGLPAGLSVSTSTGAISGTPTTVGMSYATIKAINSNGTGSATLTFTVNPPAPVITSATTATATKGMPFTDYAITATNNPTTRSATGLPSGLSVNAATGAITGTPTATGTFTASLSAANASGTGTATLSFTVNPALPVITSAATASATTGSAFTYTTVATNTPTSYTASGLPAGLSINTSSGAITGTPTIAGTFTVGIGATNITGTGTLSLTLTVHPPAPVITSGATVTGVVGTAFSGYTITANNSPTSFNATNLPAGLSVSTASGAITGTPTATGSLTVALSAINAGGTGTKNLTFTVNNPKPVISSATSAAATKGTAFSGYTITASNTPTSYSATGLPPGLSVSSSTGAITGTPTAVGTYSVTIGATNPTGTGTAVLTLTVSPPQPVINSLLTAVGTTGSAFTYATTATNSPTSFGATGLPAGLSISTSSGKISGTPTVTGTSNVSLSATNGSGSGTASLLITINAPKPVISSATTATGTVGSAFSYSTVASNSPSSYTATGLPAGLTIDPVLGTISGTPTVGGTFAVTLGATNATGTGTLTLTITISPPQPVITSLTTAMGVTGSAFSYATTASNNPASYSATGLPAGLTISTTTGKITGTPTAAGTSSVTLGATNANGTGSATLTLTVNSPAPVISSAASATGTMGAAFSYSMVASNTPTSYTATGLPAGLSLNTTSGAITGTPTVAALSTVTLGASNATGSGKLVLTLTVNPPQPVITSLASAVGVTGSSFSYAITASNSPTSYSATGLPTGLSVNTSTGIITGTPTAAGTSSVTLGATNATGTGNATLNLTVNPPVSAITSATTATGIVGGAFSYTITASNSPTTYGATGLPTGFSINTTTGVISGTPTVAGTSAVALSATNIAGMASSILTLTVNPPVPVISSATASTGTTGMPFEYMITASNSPTSYNATGLPAGLSINTTTGVISGTPTTTGTSSVTLNAINAGGTGTASLTLTINPPTPVITSAITSTGTTGVAYSYAIAASSSPTSYNATGLPTGLSVNTSTGVISGTPTTIATSSINLSATNAGGTGTRTLTLTVNAPIPVISSAATASATTGVAFSYTIAASNSPTSYNATGLPAGLSINTATGVISGTPTTIATSSVTLSASNSGGTGTLTLTLTVNPPAPVISSAASATGTTGVAFTYTIAASNSPTSFNATGLPAGLSINTTTGMISGTPTIAATSSVTLSAINAGGTGTATLTLTINPPAPVITSAITATGTTGVAFNYTIVANNSPTSFNATGLPAGLSVNTTTGVISGTPTTIATSSINLSATNGGGTGTKTLTLTVTAPVPVISSAASATGTTGVAFSYTIIASNSPTSYNATGLPAGLSVNTATGVISGTPTTIATSSVTLSATNSGGTGTKTLTLTVNPPTPVISSASTAIGTTGVAFSYTIAATNGPTSFNAVGLPNGLSINTSTGVISGTPTAIATSSVTLSASNSGGTGTRTLTLTINAPLPVISSANTASALVGIPFSYTIVASNSPTSYGATGLPSGLSINTTTGVISGTPTATGTATIALSAVNSGGTGTLNLTLTTSPSVPVTSGLSAWYKADSGVTTNGGSVTQWNDQTGLYNVTQTAGSNAPTPATDTNSGAPVVAFNGSQFLATGAQVAGVNDVTIITVGSTPVTNESGVQVQVGAGYGSACTRGFAYIGGNEAFTNGINSGGYFTSVSGGPAVQNSSLTTNTLTYSASSSVASFYSNGIANGTATLATVPIASGLIMGDAITYGNYYNWTGNIAEIIIYNRVLTTTERQQVETYLSGKYHIIPVITSPATATGTTASAFNYAITASGGPTSFGATGLPSGLSVNTSTGVISGTPMVTGTFPVTLSATNTGGTGTATLTLTVTAPLPPVITSSNSASATTGVGFNYAITASGGATSFGATGLPAGLSVNTSTGVISGAPTVTGTFPVTLSATNTGGTGTATLTLTVYAASPPVISSPTSSAATVGLGFSYSIVGSNNPTSYNATGLPAGLSINTSTGIISGTATTAATSTVALSATNAWGTGTASLVITIYPTLPVTTGLATWFNAGTGVTTYLGSVTQWNDLSGNLLNVTQTAGSTAPSVGTDPATGSPVIAFNGSQFLNSNSQVSVTNDVTIITVASTNVVNTGNYQTLVTLGNAGGTTERVSTYHGGNIGYEDGTDNVSGGSVSQNKLLTLNTLTYSQSGTLSSFYTKGVANGTAAASSTAISSGLTVGSVLNYIPWNAWNGNMAEVIVYNRVLSPTERQQVETYLANKYGIYAPGASWITTYTSAVQAEINKHQWNQSQAAAYVAMQTANPSLLTNGLISWFKADSITAANGTPVSSWTDQCGNFTNTQTVSANQPTFVSNENTGAPGVRFSGSQWLYNPGNPALNADMTMITVCAPSSTSTNYQSMLFLGNQTWYASRSQLYNGGLETFDSSNNSCAGGPEPGANQFTIETSEINSNLTNVAFFQNGQPTGTGTLTTALQNLTPGVTIGAVNNGGNPFQGDISEVLVYDHQLSAAELQQVSLALATKYNLYYPGVPWISGYAADVQAQINANHWSKVQADAFVNFQNTSGLPVSDGISAWYKADAGVTAASGSVTQWNDQSLNQVNLTQTPGGSAPTSGLDVPSGRPVVAFNGSQWISTGSILANVNDVTIITMAAPKNPGNSGAIVDIGGGYNNTTTRALAYYSGYQSFVNGWPNGGVASFHNGGPVASSTQLTLNTVTYSNSAALASFYSNGQSNGTVSVSANPLTAGVSLGSLSYYNSYYGWTGNIAEVIIYNRVLTTTERQQVETYLSNKYAAGQSAPIINSATTASVTTGQAFSYTITAIDAPTSFSATGLPAGLSVNTTTGVISGTPTVAGTSNVTLSAMNSKGTGTQNLILTVNQAPPVMTTNPGVMGIVGVAFSYTITATNNPTSFSATGLPSGLTLNSTTGVISGTVTSTGRSSVAMGATNAGGTGTSTLTLTFIASGGLSVTSGLTAWYEADSGVVTSTGTVTQWADQTGIYNLTPPYGEAPTAGADPISGKPTINFNGNQVLAAGGSVNTNDVTIIGISSTAAKITGGIAGVGNIQLSFSRFLGYQYGNQSFVDQLAAGNAAFNDGGPGSINSVLSTSSVTFSQSTGAINFYRDGLANGTATSTITPPSSGLAGVTVGCFNPNGYYGSWNGSISEVLIYNRVLSSAERQQVEEYLAKKYQLFYNVAPSISPNGGNYSGSQTVSITNPSNSGSLYYTLDGSTPTANSHLYTGPFTLTQSAPVNAAVIQNNTLVSPVATAQFYIGDSGDIGISDAWQIQYFGHIGISPMALSPGGSGLTNLQAYLYGYNPTLFSTNGDGLSDSANYQLGISGSNYTISGDGLTNAQNLALGIDPFNTQEAPITPPATNPNDHVKPVISLTQPANATLLP